jgi:DNA repair exonuclease SbcCD ATPase subunit
MSWLSRNLPTLFIEAPDSTTHLRFKGYHVFNDNNIFKLYSFKYKMNFVLESDISKIIKENTNKISINLDKIKAVKDDFQSTCLKQTFEISKLQSLIEVLTENFKKLEISKNLLEDAYGGNLEELINLRCEISKLNGIIEEKNSEKEELKNWFNSEINHREETIKSLREIINKFRVDVDALLNKADKNNSQNIEKLRKEIELLDKDFVDVAKAMKVYKKDEDRPKRGFRIKLD